MITIGATKGFSFVGHNAYQRPTVSKPKFNVFNARLSSDDKWNGQSVVVSPPVVKHELPHLTTTEHIFSPLTSRSTDKLIDSDYQIEVLNRNSFPTGFAFGTASSAYQYEGGAFEVGKGPSIWDIYTNVYPDQIANQSNGDIANDSYHRFMKDISVMKDLGVDTYRFSISWSRVIPYGKKSKGVNEKGIQYYHLLIDALLANGITPCVTIFHFDLPQYLQDAYGGFYSSEIVEDFVDFADLCFTEYGGKVKQWITVNEPHTYCTMWYRVAMEASAKCQYLDKCWDGNPSTNNYHVAHNMLLSHAAAVQLYRNNYQSYQEGKIGISLDSLWFEPYSSSVSDKLATRRALDFTFGWFMDPITSGNYPESMRLLVNGLPTFSEEESAMLAGSYDFLGYNYYSARYVQDSPAFFDQIPSYKTDGRFIMRTENSEGQLIGPLAAPDWMYVYPQGLRDMLVYIKENYNDPEIYITENGVGDTQPAENLIDTERVSFLHGHLKYLLEAINDSDVNVKGYYIWSLLDNFEWKNGYTARFGINAVDYDKGRERSNKLSAKWYKKFLNPKE